MTASKSDFISGGINNLYQSNIKASCSSSSNNINRYTRVTMKMQNNSEKFPKVDS